MQLAGSCFCGAVHFTVESRTPYPYRRCYCARCRKTAGGTGAAANVLVNLPSLDRADPFIDQATTRVDELLHEIGRLAEATRSAVLDGAARPPADLRTARPPYQAGSRIPTGAVQATYPATASMTASEMSKLA